MAFWFLLQTLQLRTICEAISQYGDGHQYGKGMESVLLMGITLSMITYSLMYRY